MRTGINSFNVLLNPARGLEGVKLFVEAGAYWSLGTWDYCSGQYLRVGVISQV